MTLPTPLSTKTRPARRHARRRAANLTTPFGQVMDLSESGACVFRKGSLHLRIGQQIALRISDGIVTLDLTAQIIRIKPWGIRRAELGLNFLNLHAIDRQRIRDLAARADPHCSPRAWLAA